MKRGLDRFRPKKPTQWMVGNEADSLMEISHISPWDFVLGMTDIVSRAMSQYIPLSQQLPNPLSPPWLWRANLGLIHFCLGFPGQKYVHMSCVTACRINLLYLGCIRLPEHMWINHMLRAQEIQHFQEKQYKIHTFTTQILGIWDVRKSTWCYCTEILTALPF